MTCRIPSVTYAAGRVLRLALLSALVFSLFPGLLPGLGTPTASAAAVSTLCYAIADDGDRLVTINRITGGNFQDVGSLGVSSVEAIEWSLNATILYAANAGVFGKINLSTGTFTQIGSGFGSGTGTETPSGDGSVVFNDIDGLAMDATTGIMYGTERNGDGTTPDDVLIQINLTTGAHVPNAFGAGKDFVSINTSSIQTGLNDVDDIAVNPVDGQMYAVANNNGGNDRLVKVNKLTGVVTDVGRLRKADGTLINDMEGFSFYNDGTFYGTTGAQGGTNSNKLWQINTANGIVTEIGTFASHGDYEAVGCLVAGSNTISGVVFEDVNGNGAYNSGTDVNRQNVTVRLYRDADNNGSYETLVNTTTSAANGTYSFEVGVTGKFQVVVDQTTLPNSLTATLTTPGSYNINFTGYGNTSTGNDFGYVTKVNVTGTVFDDANGSQVQSGSELGTNTGGTLYVHLVDSSGNIFATTTVEANGLYTFTNILNNRTYTLQLTMNNGTVGQPKPATTLPSGWVTTGENTGGTPDGTPDSHLAAVVGTTDVTGKNFGIEQLPESDDKIATRQANPGGTVAVTVPTLSGSDPEDGTLGTGMTLKITSLPTNGTLYYNNTPVTLNQVISTYDPTKLTVDPADGAVTVSFTYATIDAAGREDPTPATVTMPFDDPSYVVTKTLNTPSPVRKGELISFTIRITNTGALNLSTLPLTDVYDTTFLTFVGSGTPASEDQINDGSIYWADLTRTGAYGFGTALLPGESFSIVVHFVGREDTTGLLAQAPCSQPGHTCNVATASGVKYDPDGPGGLDEQGPLPEKSGRAAVQIIAPTAVALADVNVSYADAQAHLHWRTVNESDVFGFHLYRQVNGGAEERITAEMIPAQKPGQSDGARYDYADAGVETGNRYSYAVEFIGVDGPVGRESVGTVFTGGRIFLPTIRVGVLIERSDANETLDSRTPEDESAQSSIFLPTVGR